MSNFITGGGLTAMLSAAGAENKAVLDSIGRAGSSITGGQAEGALDPAPVPEAPAEEDAIAKISEMMKSTFGGGMDGKSMMAAMNSGAGRSIIPPMSNNMPQARLSPTVQRGNFQAQPFQGYQNGGGIPHYNAGGAIMLPMIFKAVMDMKNKNAPPSPGQGKKMMADGGALDEGMIEGPGDGRSDQIVKQVPGSGEVAVSRQEYVVPADVVSALGRGSSEAGAEMLDQIVLQVREGYRQELGALPGPK